MKINDQIFLNIQETQVLDYFWPISPTFGANKVFPKDLAVTHNFIKVSSTMSKFKEIY